MPDLIVARIEKVVHFTCGCFCIYEIVGHFSRIRQWRTTPCRKHSADRTVIETNAENLYREHVRQTLTEEDAIAYLREKGYDVITPVTSDEIFE